MANNKSSVSGNCVMLILKLVSEKDMYGYEMISELKSRSCNIFDMKVGTLYPLLHNMVGSGYLISYNMEVGGKLRKYYKITEKGEEYLKTLIDEWKKYSCTIDSMIGGLAYES